MWENMWECVRVCHAVLDRGSKARVDLQKRSSKISYSEK